MFRLLQNVGSTELSTSDYYSDVTNELKRSDKEASPNQGNGNGEMIFLRTLEMIHD